MIRIIHNCSSQDRISLYISRSKEHCSGLLDEDEEQDSQGERYAS